MTCDFTETFVGQRPDRSEGLINAMATSALTMTIGNNKPITLYRRDSKGRIVEEEASFSDWSNLPRPGSYTLEITGIGEPYEKQDPFNGGTKTSIRIECRVVDGRRTEIGKVFCDSVTYSNGERATLGQIMRAVWGELEPGTQVTLTDLLGSRFESAVKLNEKGTWASLVNNTIFAAETDGDSEAKPSVPTRATARRTAPADEDDDPFADEA